MSGLRLDLPPELVEEIAGRAAELVLERLSRTAGNGDSPYLTVAEAAEYLRCRPQRVYDLRSSGRLSRIGDGTRALVLRAELDAYLLGEGA